MSNCLGRATVAGGLTLGRCCALHQLLPTNTPLLTITLFNLNLYHSSHLLSITESLHTSVEYTAVFWGAVTAPCRQGLTAIT